MHIVEGEHAHGHSHEHKAQKGYDWPYYYTPRAENIGIEGLGGTASAEHQQKAEHYHRAGYRHADEIAALQRHAPFFFVVFLTFCHLKHY